MIVYIAQDGLSGTGWDIANISFSGISMWDHKSNLTGTRFECRKSYLTIHLLLLLSCSLALYTVIKDLAIVTQILMSLLKAFSFW